jgi:hypothetical protein
LPDAPSDDIHERIGAFILQSQMSHPATAVAELQADARAAVAQVGDFRSAIMLFHTASEVLLDLTLSALCWEEGLSPEDAAAQFSGQLMTRVRSRYHARIGGNWQTGEGSPLHSWYQDVVLIRHRVAHAGELVDRDRADRATDSFAQLSTFVPDRLVASVNRYPKSAAIIATESGFRRRDVWTRRAQSAVASVNMRTLLEFNAWRADVLAARSLL